MIASMLESGTHFLSVIRVWAALAWADGIIAHPEAVAMKRLIQTADLTDEEREIALGWLESEVELDTDSLASLGEDARLGIYQAAARLAAVDLEVAVEERAFLYRLREGLGIDPEKAKEIEAAIPGHR